MSWSRRVSCLAVSAALSSGCARSAPTLQVLGDSTRLASNRPSPLTSPFFDGHTVRLRAARGETLGLELRLADGVERQVSLELPANVARVQAFRVGSLDVTEPSTSLYGASAGRGRYPDVLEAVTGPARSAELAFFDVAVARDAAPGEYQGSLVVGDRTIPVALRVSRARIDLGPNPLVWVFYAPREIARLKGLPDGDGPELVAEETAYYELFRAHGALLASDLPPARFEARRQLMRDVKYWPVALDLTSDETIVRDVQRFIELFRGTGVTPFVIPIDEPKTRAMRERVRHVADVIGAAGGGRPSLLRAVTDHPDPIYGESIDVYFSPKAIPTPARERRPSGERFWTYNGRAAEAGSLILDTAGPALRTWGWIAERYDVELWYAWEGLYFSDRYNDGRPTDTRVDPVTFDERTKGGTDFGNGDGLLAYPGVLPSLRLKTLRRGLEDRLLLRELERCGGVAASRRIVQDAVPRALGEARATPSWALEEAGWERARSAVLDEIEVSCRD